MKSRVVKISEENYRMLNILAGIMQQESGTPVSLDAALSKALQSHKEGKKKRDGYS